MSNMGGGNWGNDLTSESLMPVSALCAENKINNLILKTAQTETKKEKIQTPVLKEVMKIQQ